MKMTSICWIFAGLLFTCFYLETSTSQWCLRNEFKCSRSKKCIPVHWRCDGKYQCGGDDYTDELGCTPDFKWKGRCRPHIHHRCSNGRCIAAQWVCDGVRHCSDGDDEVACLSSSRGCRWKQFRCENGTCTPVYLHCDCIDTSWEETDCEERVCRTNEHRCGSDNCLSPLLRCDGLHQCNDSSDEKDCDKCENFGCDHDCNETSDGPQCYCRQGFELDPEDGRSCYAHCLRNQFRCLDGKQCIRMAFLCDGHDHCFDWTDEEEYSTVCADRSCPIGQFKCSKHFEGSCHPNEFVCDGKYDCDDRSDEIGCVQPAGSCMENQFQCTDGSCIPKDYRCSENLRECLNRSEELECNTSRCNDYDFRCDSGPVNCVRKSRVCDGHEDCSDASDEKDCHTCENWGCSQNCTETSNWPRCHCRLGFELDDQDQRTCHPIISVPDCLRNQFRCADGKRCITAANVCDSDPHCDDGSDEYSDMCANRQCPVGEQLKCDGGRCHPDELRCDGRMDCKDGSDEMECPSPPAGSCMDNQFQCPNGSCFPKVERCLNTDLRRCLNRSEELKCIKSWCNEAYQRPCDYDANDCVKKTSVCDGYEDCADASDEKDCDTCENWGCSQNCTETSNWPRCHCRLGFELDKHDQRTCNPIFFADVSIDNSTGPAYVMKGGKFILTCRFTGGDMHLWIKDGIIIASPNIIHKVYLEGYSTAYSKKDSDLVTTMRLIVEHADSDHTGEYKCSTDALYSQNVTVVTDPSILNETDSNTEF